MTHAPGGAGNPEPIARPIAIDYDVSVSANLLTWLALVAQTISAWGSGFVLCINCEGKVRLEIAAAPCTLCAHSHEDADSDDDCVPTDDALPLDESGLNAKFSPHVCACLHQALADVAMIPCVSQPAAGDQLVTAFANLTAGDLHQDFNLAGQHRCHDPPYSDGSTTPLILICSVVLRC